MPPTPCHETLPSGPRRRSRPGFTLLELLIGVALVGILAAVAIPTYMRFLQGAREVSAIHQLQEIHKAQLKWRLLTGAEGFTGDFAELERTGALPPAVAEVGGWPGLVAVAHAGEKAAKPEREKKQKEEQAAGTAPAVAAPAGDPAPASQPPEATPAPTESATAPPADSSRSWHGYRFALEVGSGTAAEATYRVVSAPENGRKDVRWFYLDQTGTIRACVGSAGPACPPL